MGDPNQGAGTTHGDKRRGPAARSGSDPAMTDGASPLRLRQWREIRALTPQELAARAGVSRRTVVALETGAHRPWPATGRALAAALGVRSEVLRATPPTG